MIVETIHLSKTTSLLVMGDRDYPNSSLQLMVVRRQGLWGKCLHALGLGGDRVLDQYPAHKRLHIYDATMGDKEGVTIVALDDSLLFIDRSAGLVTPRALQCEVETDEMWMVRRPSRLVCFRPLGDWAIHAVERVTSTNVVSNQRYMPLFTRDGRVDKNAKVAIFSMTGGQYNLVRWHTPMGLDFKLYGDLTGAQERTILETDKSNPALLDLPRAHAAQLFKMDDYIQFKWNRTPN